MKSIDEITRLSADDLERIALDESIPVPEELSGRVSATLARQRSRSWARWAIPAAAAAAVLVGIGLNREPQPKDTFDDPYLAYAEVEKVFAKISGAVAYGAEKVNESEQTIDKYAYWK